MKVYIIEGNNGELYGDYYKWIEGIYLNKENAKNELKRLRKVAHDDHIKDPFYEERLYEIEEYEIKDYKVEGEINEE